MREGLPYLNAGRFRGHTFVMKLLRKFAPLILSALIAVPAAAQTLRITLDVPLTGVPAVSAPAPFALSAPALSVPSLAPLSASFPVLSAPAVPSALAITPVTALKPAQVAAAQSEAVQSRAQALIASIQSAPSTPDRSGESSKADADKKFDGAAPSKGSVAAIPASPASPGHLRLHPSLSAASARDFKTLDPRRPLRGVFIQQEHEGSLLHGDSRDSSGNVFRWYRPVVMRPDLVAEVEASMSGAAKLAYRLRRTFAFSGRSSPYAPWNAWSTESRLLYLEKLEKAVDAERGPGAAMNGKETLILERTPEAPAYLTQHPHLEPVHPHMNAGNAPGARFLWPEIVSAKDSPAASVSEAIGRTGHIIAQTGHAGTQYHVFMKVSPERLKAQLKEIDGAVQLFNDILFARAAGENLQNVAIRALSPWHAGRSARFGALVEKASPLPRTSVGDDSDSEKHAFVGMRYWGMEEGKYVISLEFRGVNLPWKPRGGSSATKGMEMPVAAPERDYSDAERWLTMISAYSESVVEGRAPRAGLKTVTLDAAAVDAQFAAWAELQGQPKDSYIPYSELAKRISGLSAVPGGYLLPFAADDLMTSPSLQQLANEALHQAQKAKSHDAAPGKFEINERHDQYRFWDAYKSWAAGFDRRRTRELETLIGAAAR